MKFNIFQAFTPRDKKFFPLFEKATSNLLLAADVLVDLTTSTDQTQRKVLIKRIQELELIGDEITHEAFHELSANFITPFDREDVHELVSEIDDVMDFIHGAAKRIELYNLSEIPASFARLADLILEGVHEIHFAVGAMKDLKNSVKIYESISKIGLMESRADDIFNAEIAALFHNETDAIELIKKKEILQTLETATDTCDDVANVIESILVKNA